jgi:hypothetical protein
MFHACHRPQLNRSNKFVFGEVTSYVAYRQCEPSAPQPVFFPKRERSDLTPISRLWHPDVLNILKLVYFHLSLSYVNYFMYCPAELHVSVI